MTKYVAKTNTGIYPYGIVRKGDVLQQKHLDALGKTGIAVLIGNGVIAEVKEESGVWRVECGDEKAHEAPAPALPEAGEVEDPDEDFEDGDELTDLEGLDDLAGEAEGGTTSSDPAESGHLPMKGKAKEASAETARKPRSRKKTGGKNQ